MDNAIALVIGVISSLIAMLIARFYPPARTWFVRNWRWIALTGIIFITFILIHIEYLLYQFNMKLDQLSSTSLAVITVIASPSPRPSTIADATLAATPISSPIPQLTPTSTPIPSLVVDNIAFDYRKYEGGVGIVDSSVSLITRDGKNINQYEYDYNIPDSGQGWAGVNFDFRDVQDVSDYTYLEMDISCDDRTAIFYLNVIDDSNASDNSKGKAAIRLGDSPLLVCATKTQHVSIALDKYLNAINLHRLRTINFDVNDSVMRGKHSIYISNMRFTK